MVDSFTWQNVSAPKGPSSVAKKDTKQIMNLYIDVVMNLYSIITVLVVLCVPHVAALSLVPIGMWHINTKNIHKEWNCATNDDHCTTNDEHCTTNDDNL